MNISELKGQQIGILGFGLEGKAMHRLLAECGQEANITVFSDEGADPAMVRQAFGRLDVLIRSPGFRPSHPFRQLAEELDLVQTTATNIFLSEMRQAGVPCIGITGSGGKSTTSSLVKAIFDAANVESLVLGNIGEPAIQYLDVCLRGDVLPILELSSFQCADLERGNAPAVACLLDIFPDHQDWHPDYAHYVAAKARLVTHQPEGAVAFATSSALAALASIGLDPHCVEIGAADAWHLRGDDIYCADDRVAKLAGYCRASSNARQSALAAVAIADHFQVDGALISNGIASFTGLAHRNESLGMHRGIHWINDSASKTCDSTVMALQGAAPSRTALIFGGLERAPYNVGVLDEVRALGLKYIFVLPETGHKYAQHLKGVDTEVVYCDDLTEAVSIASSRLEEGDVCVFSPGAPSYNAYGSLADRGEHFRKLVERLMG